MRSIESALARLMLLSGMLGILGVTYGFMTESRMVPFFHGLEDFCIAMGISFVGLFVLWMLARAIAPREAGPAPERYRGKTARSAAAEQASLEATERRFEELQNRIEQRVTNLETILLDRPRGIGADTFQSRR